MEGGGIEQQAQRLSGGGAAGAPRPVDATRVLNLFGYVGPVASLMTHTLLAHGQHAADGRDRGRAPRPPSAGAAPGHGHGHSHGGGHGDGRLMLRAESSPVPGKSGGTRFVLSQTEDAIDSVLPCAAERMFKRPGKFGNPNNLRFSYH